MLIVQNTDSKAILITTLHFVLTKQKNANCELLLAATFIWVSLQLGVEYYMFWLLLTSASVNA